MPRTPACVRTAAALMHPARYSSSQKLTKSSMSIESMKACLRPMCSSLTVTVTAQPRLPALSLVMAKSEYL